MYKVYDKQCVLLQAYGVKAFHLSLRFPTCSARDNGTHFLLSTKLSECGTQVVQKNDIDIYQNAVSIPEIPFFVTLPHYKITEI